MDKEEDLRYWLERQPSGHENSALFQSRECHGEESAFKSSPAYPFSPWDDLFGAHTNAKPLQPRDKQQKSGKRTFSSREDETAMAG